MLSVLQNLFSDIPMLLLRIPVILLALSMHEAAHGYAAYRLGDPTARNMGRLSLNPVKHLDPLGTIMMFVFGFGWARPVPINPRYFKNPKYGMAISAAAGPIANLLLGFLGLFCANLFWFIMTRTGLIFEAGGMLYAGTDSTFLVNLITYTHLFFYLFYMLNVSLGVFNLIPVPPLDGSRIFLTFLPPKLYFQIMRYEHIIQIVLMLGLWMGFLDTPMRAAVSFVMRGMEWLVGLIPIF